ncbi:MAG: carbohydrate kinase family protein [Actinomycetota bacterium]
MDLITVGDVMVDVHVRAGALARGGDVHGTVRLQPAGTSATAAVWAAWDGASARVHGRAGDDLAGRLLRDALAERGVEPSLATGDEAPTGTMLVVVEEGERSMVADRGANACLAPADLPASLRAGAVLVSGYLILQEPTTATALTALERAESGLVAVEASSWPLLQAFGPERFLDVTLHAGATAVFANDREAEVLTGETGAAAAATLGQRYRLVCVKRGRLGAAMSFDERLIEAGAEPVVEVDSTGAGDAFDGILLAALARGAEPEEALGRAVHAGALVAGSDDTWPSREQKR